MAVGWEHYEWSDIVKSYNYFTMYNINVLYNILRKIYFYDFISWIYFMLT